METKQRFFLKLFILYLLPRSILKFDVSVFWKGAYGSSN